MIALLVGLASCKNPTSVEYEPYESPGEEHPNDEYYDLQWHYRQINMPGAWAILRDSELDGAFGEAVVAVLDTGILSDHPDFEDANLRFNGGSDQGGYDFYSGAEAYPNTDGAGTLDGEEEHGGLGRDQDPTDTGDGEQQSSWHGSHVSGTIAAQTVAATGSNTGVAGIGWNELALLPIRSLGMEGGSLDDIAAGIYYAAGLRPQDSAPTPEKAAHVINLSIGGYIDSDPVLYDAIEAAVSEGVTVTAAVGNDGSGSVRQPASYDNTIAVAATDVAESVSYYSNEGSEVDFAAPGGDLGADIDGDGYRDGVWSTIYDDQDEVDYAYAAYEGTSMATPHVSGVVGLLYSYAPNLTQDAVYAVLQNTAKDLGEPGHDEQYGHGLIDAEAALEYLINAGRDFPVQPRSSNTSSSGGTTSGGSSVSDATVEHLSAEGSGVTRGRGPSKRSGAILPEAGSDYQADSIIVKLTEEAAGGATQVGPAGSDSPGTGSTDGGGRAGAEAARALAAERGAGQPKALGGRLYRFDLASGDEVRRAIQALGQKADVEYAQPNYRYELID